MRAGDVLGGKYRLTRELGKGAMRAVWAAYDLESKRTVAVKFILPPHKEQLTNELRQRMVQEARACSKLRHRHIVQVYDVVETADGEPFMVLEMLRGQTVAQLLNQKRRVDPAMAARIVAEAATALEAAHSAKVVHGALEPTNLYLHREEGMSEGIIKVLGFGARQTLDNMGTSAYMSPEQAAMRKDLDHRTDIWSLGIVLYELLTGTRPFAGTASEVAGHILMTSVPPPSAKVSHVSVELDLVVAVCTAQKRENRYARAQDLANALLAIVEKHQREQRKIAGLVRMAAPPAQARVPRVTPKKAPSAEENGNQASEAKPPPNASETMPSNASPAANDLDIAPVTSKARLILVDESVAEFAPPLTPEIHSNTLGQSIADATPPSVEETSAATTTPLPIAMPAPVQGRYPSSVLFGAGSVIIAAVFVLWAAWKINQDKPKGVARESVPQVAMNADSLPNATPEAKALSAVLEPEEKPESTASPPEKAAIEKTERTQEVPMVRPRATGVRNHVETGTPLRPPRPAIKSGKKPCKQDVFRRCTS